MVGDDGVRQAEEIIGKIRAAERADERHDDVVDQGIDDLAESRADDHADGEIDDIALHGEFSEFLQHASLPYLPSRRNGQFNASGLRKAS